MKKLFLFFALFFISFWGNAQTEIPFAGFFADVSDLGGVSNGLYIIQVTVNDQSGKKSGLDITTDNFVFWQNCRRYEVDSIIISFAGEVVIGVRDDDGNGAPILGSAVILEETEQGIGHFISGTLASLNQCMASYYAQFSSSTSFFLSDGTQIFSGDTLTPIQCIELKLTAPFDYEDFIILSSVFLDTVYGIDLFVNGIFFDKTAYDINGDTLFFMTYQIQSSDEIVVKSCKTLAPLSPPPFVCYSELFSHPFDYQDRIVLPNGVLANHAFLFVFINGVSYDYGDYDIDGDSIIFNNISLIDGDLVYVSLCSSQPGNIITISANNNMTQNLTISGDTLSITGGNSVVLPNNVIGGGDLSFSGISSPFYLNSSSGDGVFFESEGEAKLNVVGDTIFIHAPKDTLIKTYTILPYPSSSHTDTISNGLGFMVYGGVVTPDLNRRRVVAVEVTAAKPVSQDLYVQIHTVDPSTNFSTLPFGGSADFVVPSGEKYKRWEAGDVVGSGSIPVTGAQFNQSLMIMPYISNGFAVGSEDYVANEGANGVWVTLYFVIP
jgi:hypothetical protein